MHQAANAAEGTPDEGNMVVTFNDHVQFREGDRVTIEGYEGSHPYNGATRTGYFTVVGEIKTISTGMGDRYTMRIDNQIKLDEGATLNSLKVNLVS
jgi:hypothetical protein